MTAVQPALSGGNAVGLSWQQGPLSPGAIGRFLVPEPLPKRLLWDEPLRRRRAEDFGGNRQRLQTNRSWCGRSSSSSSERDWSLFAKAATAAAVSDTRIWHYTRSDLQG